MAAGHRGRVGRMRDGLDPRTEPDHPESPLAPETQGHLPEGIDRIRQEDGDQQE
jgi:hypothetical protein